MEFEELLSILDFNTMKVVKLRKKSQRIVSLLYFSDPVSSASVVSPDTICFGSTSQFNAVEDQYLSHGSFVLYLDEPIKPLPADVNVITFREMHEYRTCYNVLSTEMRSYRQTCDRIFYLTELVSRGVGLKALLNRISEIFDVPCNVLDNSLSIVAHSDNFPDWITDGNKDKNAFLPERAQAAMKAEGLVSHASPDTAKVFSWYDDQGVLCYNHYAAISISDTVIGSVSLFTQLTPMRKSRVDLLPWVAQILSIEMQKSNVYLMNKSVYYSHLFTDIINGSIGEDPDAIRYRFSIFGYSLRTFKRIVFADLSREYMDTSQTQALAERLHQVLDNNIYVVTEQGIILLTSRNSYLDDGIYCERILPDDVVERGLSAAPKPDENVERAAHPEEEGAPLQLDERLDLCDLADVVRGTNVRIGISSIFTNVLHVPSYFIQAQRAISTGSSYGIEGPLYFYSNFRVADMLSHVEDQNALYTFRYPPLMHVIREDMRHGTSLAFTLFVYLQDPAHPAAVCEKLFIHKNTLYYRLDRIKSLMGVDIKNGWVISQIELTFLILKHQGKFEELVLPRQSDDAAEGAEHAEGKKRGRKPKQDAPKKPRSKVQKIVENESAQPVEREPHIIALA